MNDQGISASIPLLGHYSCKKSSLLLGSDKSVLPDKQGYCLHCKDQEWRPSLSQVSFTDAAILILLFVFFEVVFMGLKLIKELKTPIVSPLCLFHLGGCRDQRALYHSFSYDHHGPTYIWKICHFYAFHGEIRERGFSRRVSLHWHSKHHWLLCHFRSSYGHGGHLLSSLWSQAMASYGPNPSANDSNSHLGMHTHISSLAQL
jgi:hypothetical protein